MPTPEMKLHWATLGYSGLLEAMTPKEMNESRSGYLIPTSSVPSVDSASRSLLPAGPPPPPPLAAPPPLLLPLPLDEPPPAAPEDLEMAV